MRENVIGKRLIALRGNKTREEVARAVGISPSSIAMYELGERTPRDGIKVALANYYGVSIESLFYTSMFTKSEYSEAM